MASTIVTQQNSDLNAAPVLLKDTPFASEWHIQDWQRSGSNLFPIPIANSNQNAFLTRSLAGGSSYTATLVAPGTANSRGMVMVTPHGTPTT